MIFKRILAVALTVAVLVPQAMKADDAEPLVPVRIGWQMPAVTQAGLAQVLKRTDVLAQHGLDPSLVPYSFGTPQVEAAYEGKLDVLFAGDQPVLNLLAQGGKWKIVARAFYDRLAIVVPPESPIRTIADLEGKRVGSPFGSIGHREAIQAQEEAGLDPAVDVTNVDVDVLEIQQRILEGGIEEWEGMDAAAIWEPNVSSFQQAGLTRHLAEAKGLGVVAMSDEFIRKNPEAAAQFLIALTRAWEFFANDPTRVMRWYGDDTQLGYSREALLAALEIDPNIDAQSITDIDMDLGEDLLVRLERNAAWDSESWPDGSEVRQYVDLTHLERARQEVAANDFGELQVILPSIRTVESLETVWYEGLDAVPLFLVFAFMVVVALGALELGIWLGSRAETVSPLTARPVGTVAAAVLGMMAFVIALTFGSATNRFDARKTALLEDVTAIETAYVRANMLAEPYRTTTRSLLRDYVQARAGIVYAYGQPETLEMIERHAHTLQAMMWSRVEEMAEEGIQGAAVSSFTASLDEVSRLHTKRVVLGAYYRIPGFLWLAIIFASAVAMVAVGFQFGIGDGRRVMTANIALALTFALVMMLAFDLDRAGEGLVSVNQQPMIDLYKNLSARQ